MFCSLTVQTQALWLCGVSHQTDTNVLLAVQVGVPAPHDHVWSLHFNNEVSLLKDQISHHASTQRTHRVYCIYCKDVSKQYSIGYRFNSQILAFVTIQLRSGRPCSPGSEEHREDKAGEDASACNTSMVLLNKGQQALE